MNKIDISEADEYEALYQPKSPFLDDPGFDILGLSESERKILIAAWNIAKSLSNVSRLSGVPAGSLPYMLKKLEKRHLVRRFEPMGKAPYWRSDVPRAVRSLQGLASRYHS
jgi:hypothetical protein